MFWHKWLTPKPFNSGFLPPENGHSVYFAEFGNPQGIPVVVFHGGPGGCFSAYRAAYANLRKYHVIMFDQRGSGRSLPLGKLENNTTQDLLNDTTRLINYLKIEQKVILWGASWGATLALLWAVQNPNKVKHLLLSQVFLANKDYREWEFNGNRYNYPEFVAEMNMESSGNIKGYYNKLIQSDVLDEQLLAANRYGWFERVCGSLTPAFSNFKELSPTELAEQRIYMHYSVNNFFLGSDDIMDNINKIKNIPAVIIHNRLDFIGPLKGAYDIHQKLPNSRLIIVPSFGHTNKLIRKIIKKEFSKVLK